MPNIEEHSNYTFKRYGITGEEIHNWMDEPVKLFGGSHRKVRHDPNQEVPIFLIDLYGIQRSKNIMIDHILLDSQTSSGDTLLFRIKHPPKQVTQNNTPVDNNSVSFEVWLERLFQLVEEREEAEMKRK